MQKEIVDKLRKSLGSDNKNSIELTNMIRNLNKIITDDNQDEDDN